MLFFKFIFHNVDIYLPDNIGMYEV